MQRVVMMSVFFSPLFSIESPPRTFDLSSLEIRLVDATPEDLNNGLDSFVDYKERRMNRSIDDAQNNMFRIVSGE
jgi:hypothetical protein